eukprot:2641291-Karenia_brevis.AAC.1
MLWEHLLKRHVLQRQRCSSEEFKPGLGHAGMKPKGCENIHTPHRFRMFSIHLLCLKFMAQDEGPFLEVRDHIRTESSGYDPLAVDKRNTSLTV